jgi:ubiquinone/menaquinone biosynthesis C-methylase UbiE
MESVHTFGEDYLFLLIIVVYEIRGRRSENTMSTEPLKENQSTYFVQDRGNIEEMKRLEIQDKMLTLGMGGVLEDVAEPSQLHRVLDVGCGTGGWLMEVAQTYPTIERLVGVDISSTMIAYAREKAKAEGLDKRVEFQTMDALRILEFLPASFDLVNQRLGMSWLRTWDWTKLLIEYQRVCRRGGIIGITEGHVSSESNSPALDRLYHLSVQACFRSGRLFASSTDGLTGSLARLLTQHGIENVKTHIHTLVYRSGTQTGEYFYEDMLHAFRVALPFLQKWTRVPDDYQEIYQQALKEMRAANFEARYTLVSAWGTRSDGEVPRMRGLN